MEPCNSILPRDMNKHIKRTSRTVGTPPIPISTTCYKYSPVRVAFSPSTLESSICTPSLSVRSTAPAPAKSSLLLLIRLPPFAPSHLRSPNSSDPITAMMDSILPLWLKTSEHCSTIHKKQPTACQYSMACRRLSSIWVVTRRIYQMNNCMQWSSVFTIVLKLKLRV